MSFSPLRRQVLCGLWTLPLAPTLLLLPDSLCSAAMAQGPVKSPQLMQEQLAALEKASKGRLGLALMDTSMRQEKFVCSYRSEERFPLCSTAKLMIVGAILNSSMRDKGLLLRPISITRQALVAHSPIVKKFVDRTLPVATLCAATLQYSDNTAANLLLDILGGPQAVTAFALSIGDKTFRLDRNEPTLNSSLPGDPRDTSSPAAMALSLQKIALGRVLDPPLRLQLQTWLRGNTTGDSRIRASLPPTWKVGDKTGSGDYGTTNDIAVLWPPMAKPLILCIYFTQEEPTAPIRNDVVAAAAKIVCGS